MTGEILTGGFVGYTGNESSVERPTTARRSTEAREDEASNESRAYYV